MTNVQRRDNWASNWSDHIGNKNLWNIWQTQSINGREQDFQNGLENVSLGSQTSNPSILPHTPQQFLGSIPTLLLYDPGVANRFMSVE